MTLGALDGRSVEATSDIPVALLLDLSAFCFCSSSTISSTGNEPMTSSRTVGRSAKTVNVQSSWFCSNRLRRLSQVSLVAPIHDSFLSDFSFAIRSSPIRSRASNHLFQAYCPAKYTAPTAPAPIANRVRFRWNHRRVASIIAALYRAQE